MSSELGQDFLPPAVQRAVAGTRCVQHTVDSPASLASGLHAQPSAARTEHQLSSFSQHRHRFLSWVSQLCAMRFPQRLPQAPVLEQWVGCCCLWGPWHCYCSNPCSSTALASQTAPSSLLEGTKRYPNHLLYNITERFKSHFQFCTTPKHCFAPKA